MKKTILGVLTLLSISTSFAAPQGVYLCGTISSGNDYSEFSGYTLQFQDVNRQVNLSLLKDATQDSVSLFLEEDARELGISALEDGDNICIQGELSVEEYGEVLFPKKAFFTSSANMKARFNNTDHQITNLQSVEEIRKKAENKVSKMDDVSLMEEVQK